MKVVSYSKICVNVVSFVQWPFFKIVSTGIPAAQALEAAALLVECAENELAIPDFFISDLIHLANELAVTFLWGLICMRGQFPFSLPCTKRIVLITLKIWREYFPSRF